MSDPLISRFADQCGAPDPLDLRVELADGSVLAEGSVRQPFTLVGRDDACDVTLTDPDVNPRHVWLQAVGGRVFAVDLGSRTGLKWAGGVDGSGWLDVDRPVGVGPFRLNLRSAISPHPVPFPDGYSPLHSDASVTRTRPSVGLEFRNGKRAKDRWTVNRLVTLIGRSADCKIHLNADDIAGFHCGLVLTPGGLWVVDLSGRGVVVNGERMRVAPLPHGAEMWVGRFLIGCVYPGVVNTPATGRPGSLTPPTPLPFPAPRPVPGRDEEVELGESVSDATGLPNSHIFADAFRFLSEQVGEANAITGPISQSILVTGSLPTPTVIPVPEVRPVPPPEATATAEVQAPDPRTFPAIRQLALIHAQTIELLQQSQALMTERVVGLPLRQVEELQAELSRLAELNSELGTLQERALRGAAGRPVGPDSPTPPPEVGSNAAAAIRDWVFERLATVQRERTSRWERVFALVTGKPSE